MAAVVPAMVVPAFFMGEWKGVIGTRLVTINLETTVQTNKLVGWYTFRRIPGGDEEVRMMFTNASFTDDNVIKLEDSRERLVITAWVTNTVIAGAAGNTSNHIIGSFEQERVVTCVSVVDNKPGQGSVLLTK